ncbi:MAG: VWA-like domain-containing protein [Streptosporangiales bacterium]|nr:VWA-like domain-containing protein [Streptosporangiales bacterium]
MGSDLPGLGPARLWAARKFPYLATGLFGAPVTADPGSGTVSVDRRWRMLADPDLTARWSAAELGSVLVHHVCHLIRDHSGRASALGVGPPESPRWIRAADAEINDDLIPAGLELPGSPVTPADFGAREGKLAEEYFEMLGQARVVPSPSAWFDCGSGADGRHQDGPGDEDGLSDAQADLLRRQVARDVARAGREPGAVPSGLLRWARDVLSPQVDWRRLLAAELRRAVADVAGAADYSYRRPSRRAPSSPAVVLPALRRPVPELAVVCDTSASMTPELLEMALAEVSGLLRGLGLARRLRVLACDTAVGPAQRITKAREVTLFGGGGTNMGAGIAAASALRPRPSVCVVLTDGYTPWPGQAPRGMRVIAGLLGPDAPDAPPWARAVRVTPDHP